MDVEKSIRFLIDLESTVAKGNTILVDLPEGVDRDMVQGAWDVVFNDCVPNDLTPQFYGVYVLTVLNDRQRAWWKDPGNTHLLTPVSHKMGCWAQRFGSVDLPDDVFGVMVEGTDDDFAEMMGEAVRKTSTNRH